MLASTNIIDTQIRERLHRIFVSFLREIGVFIENEIENERKNDSGNDRRNTRENDKENDWCLRRV